jgi:hypothetical protein
MNSVQKKGMQVYFDLQIKGNDSRAKISKTLPTLGWQYCAWGEFE